ncbi:hypothetical protein Pse7367_2845 [Thalassoporum mexicanum PCC 7367]|uniref:hypothetical protein n=1 Tax=Thalassoporum mexicanum TaxID=3457544 RepID=UPI00029FAA63|nr:hypothetical protein [Pseudanabaena sp. PCC 7367]AFY71098.1 hypothetical protein Pse7367_2845 [Pseudanabaena sp. PCC 7367]
MKRQNPVEQLFSDPTKNFVFFLFLSAFLLPLISDGFSKLVWDDFFLWLKTNQGVKELWLIKLALAVAMLVLFSLLVYATSFARWLTQTANQVFNLSPEVPTKLEVEKLLETSRGLIVVMSRKNSKIPEPAAEVAIKHHLQGNKLEHCWIICTNDSFEYAGEMLKKLEGEQLLQSRNIHFYYGDNYKPLKEQGLSLLIPSNEKDNPNHINKVVNAIYLDANEKGLEETDLIADYTGGTKSMTAGMILACASPDRRLQYISQSDKNPIMEIRLSYRLKQIKNKK